MITAIDGASDDESADEAMSTDMKNNTNNNNEISKQAQARDASGSENFYARDDSNYKLA